MLIVCIVVMLKGSLLQELVEKYRLGQTSQTPLNYGVYYKNTLVALCHALEDSVLETDCNPAIVTAFQRGKWYLQEADRYADLSEKSRSVTIMAAPDGGFQEHPTSQKPNVAIVSLDPDDPVAQEWHLMILSPSYTAMVMCQELTPEDYGEDGVPDVDVERKFYGFWTFEPELVLTSVHLAVEHLQKIGAAEADPLAQRVAQIETEARTYDRELDENAVDLNAVVTRVVHYLRDSHEDLSAQVETDTFPHQRALERNIVSNKLQAFLRMAQLIDLTDTENPLAATEVSSLCEIFGQLLDLPAWQMKRLKLAGLLHRIDYLPGSNPEAVEEAAVVAERGAAPCCPLRPGAQVLRTMPQLRAVAKIVTHQTEWWDGSGQPAGLSFDAIPLESRILGLIADFQQRVSQLSKSQRREEALAQALADCQGQSGDRWDPKLVETLALLVMGMQQGMTLPTQSFKVSAGMWLLDRPQDVPETAPSPQPSSSTSR